MKSSSISDVGAITVAAFQTLPRARDRERTVKENIIVQEGIRQDDGVRMDRSNEVSARGEILRTARHA